MAWIEHEIERQPCVVLDEAGIHPAQDPAICFAELVFPVRAGPLPLGRQLKALSCERVFDDARTAPFIRQVIAFWILRQDWCAGDSAGQRSPEKNVSVEVDEWLVLQAVGYELAERPQAGIFVPQAI